MKPELPSGVLMSLSDASVSASANAAPNPPVRRTMQSQQLFGLANEVLIEHSGFTYRLRITSANKLILTK